MKIKKEERLIELLNNFQKNINVLPSFERIKEEVRMMNFKIRPLSGDVNLLRSLDNKELVSVLWKIGKLDEFFESLSKHTKKPERAMINNFLGFLKTKIDNELNQVKLKFEKAKGNPPSFFEMEIVKERNIKNKVN